MLEFKTWDYPKRRHHCCTLTVSLSPSSVFTLSFSPSFFSFFLSSYPLSLELSLSPCDCDAEKMEWSVVLPRPLLPLSLSFTFSLSQCVCAVCSSFYGQKTGYAVFPSKPLPPQSLLSYLLHLTSLGLSNSRRVSFFFFLSSSFLLQLQWVRRS